MSSLERSAWILLGLLIAFLLMTGCGGQGTGSDVATSTETDAGAAVVVDAGATDGACVESDHVLCQHPKWGR